MSSICLTGCQKEKETIKVGNINLAGYMSQLNGVWVNTDGSSNSYHEISFETSTASNNQSTPTYTIKITDSFGIATIETITDIYSNNDYMKTYTIQINDVDKYSFYMTDSNNIVFEDIPLQKNDEYFDAKFAEIEGTWTNENGIKVTFFINKGTKYVNLMDGYGTFNKRIFDIDAASDKATGNYIKTKESGNFINFYYDLCEDGSLSFYDYILYRSDDSTELEKLEVEEIIETPDEETEESSNETTSFGNQTGYEVADYSGDIPTDTGYIFVGDSRFVGMNSACGISSKSNQFVVAKIGQGYYWLVNEAMDQIDYIISNHSASSWVVIFNLGINDLTNYSKYVQFYSSLASKPYKVVIVSVNPVGNYPSISNEDDVIPFNNRLKNLGYSYVDSYSYLMNERGYVTGDGLHYSNSTYQDIYKFIIYSVKGIQLSQADREALDNQYHGGSSTSSNSISDNSTSNNSVSNNNNDNNESLITTTSDGYSFANIEEFYKDENNSVEFSNRIQSMKANCSAIFSNITVSLDGNTIIYNYSYGIDMPEVDWDATDQQLRESSSSELLQLHQDSGVSSPITIGYIYYDISGNAVHSYYNEG